MISIMLGYFFYVAKALNAEKQLWLMLDLVKFDTSFFIKNQSFLKFGLFFYNLSSLKQLNLININFFYLLDSVKTHIFIIFSILFFFLIFILFFLF